MFTFSFLQLIALLLVVVIEKEELDPGNHHQLILTTRGSLFSAPETDCCSDDTGSEKLCLFLFRDEEQWIDRRC